MKCSLCYYICVAIITICYFEANAYSVLSDSCETFDNKTGTCTSVNDCESYKNLPIETYHAHVNASSCDKNDPTPKICCPVTVRTERTDHVVVGHDPTPLSPYLPSLQDCQIGLDDKIINGEKMALNEFPWLALLQYGDGEFHCGGTLINKKYVLSAAHCLPNHNVDSSRFGPVVSVRLGEYDITNNGSDCVTKWKRTKCNLPPQDIAVEDVVIHPSWSIWDKTKNNDIGLVRLQHDAQLTEFVQPTCLPNLKMNFSRIVAAGWGSTENDFYNLSPVKLKAQLPFVNRTECLKSYGGNVTLHEGQICAGGDGKDICSGDSGGPLMGFNKELDAWFCVGVVSAGYYHCGRLGTPSLFVDVNYYVDWIVMNVKE